MRLCVCTIICYIAQQRSNALQLHRPRCKATSTVNPISSSHLAWTHRHPSRHELTSSSQQTDTNEVDRANLKLELERYMQARKDAGADERAAEDVGRTVGGTRGNLVLEYISGAPRKEFVAYEAPANPLDYSELAKYGFSHLATPIMKAGGRFEAYRLLGLEPPVVTYKAPKAAPMLIIDRTGETDKNRYSGLKLGQVLDDNIQAEALEKALRQSKAPKTTVLSKLGLENYELPFADRPNTSVGWVPDWTPERLDEWGKQRGRAVSWARQAKKVVTDPMETLDVDAAQRGYSILAALFLTMSFGKSTDSFVLQIAGNLAHWDVAGLLHMLHGPSLTLLLGAVGSSVLCANMAASLNRSSLVWAVKGFIGGPVSIRVLSSCAPLSTPKEAQDAKGHTGLRSRK